MNLSTLSKIVIGWVVTIPLARRNPRLGLRRARSFKTPVVSPGPRYRCVRRTLRAAGRLRREVKGAWNPLFFYTQLLFLSRQAMLVTGVLFKMLEPMLTTRVLV